MITLYVNNDLDNTWDFYDSAGYSFRRLLGSRISTNFTLFSVKRISKTLLQENNIKLESKLIENIQEIYYVTYYITEDNCFKDILVLADVLRGNHQIIFL